MHSLAKSLFLVGLAVLACTSVVVGSQIIHNGNGGPQGAGIAYFFIALVGYSIMTICNVIAVLVQMFSSRRHPSPKQRSEEVLALLVMAAQTSPVWLYAMFG